jgi:hypothetical protein
MADEHECDMCGATFDSEEELQQHNEEEHADEM